ncbi:hypothetical protein DE146DRAFT_754627 [Phaeosphaeria sp. MPI-PUGE-AT-0046c]|nr:hypothetical protein DE146DRAFT_754627 [Phaeosphaeria sp. MPI-PUGE-AT-0046c]
MSSVSVAIQQTHHDAPDCQRPPPALMDLKVAHWHAAEYLTFEIMEWIEAHRSESDALAFELPPPKWFEPSYHKIRLTTFVAHHFRIINEQFKHNPYGLGAGWFWVVMAAAFSFIFGHIMLGTIEGLTLGNWMPGLGFGMRSAILKVLVPVLRGAMNGLPVVWMLIAFCFPALIANLQEQFYALGIDVEL